MNEDTRRPAAPISLDRVTARRDLSIIQNNHHYEIGVVSNTAMLTGRSLYVSQVREFLAPVNGLQDRDHELEDLAAFCRGDDPYLWIRAEPWAGKSALLSWFTLFPPSEMTVIGFFITDRLADQNTHTAFTAAILDQLAVLLPDQQALIAAATINRDGLRSELLTLAARREADNGRRLVLVVDGLDEDTGKPPIVTLLPPRPDANLRVIVASRHGPTLPIPRNHPLAGAKTRPLTSSPFAADVRDQAVTELGALLRGPVEHRDLLALITTANGLTASELTDLTGMAPFEIHELLHAVAGRSLRTRSDYSSPGNTADPVYALAHETLQRTAETELGTTYINKCLDQLHAWADRYRDLAWPDHTPDFLLRRYFPILDKHNELSRMVDLALDAGRHDRIRARMGSDWIALNEIRLAQQRIYEQPDPGLLKTARLTNYRDYLHRRNDNIPHQLLTVWARLGNLERAETVARSDANPQSRVHGLVDLAVAVAATHPEHTVRLIDEATVAASDISQTSLQGFTLANVAEQLASIDFDRAEVIARDIADPLQRAQALTWLAHSAAEIEPGRVLRLVREAEAASHAIHDPDRRDRVIQSLADVTNRLDIDEAEAVADSITDQSLKFSSLLKLARLAAATDPDRAIDLIHKAEAVARGQTEMERRANEIIRVASVAASIDPDRCMRIVDDAETIARGLPKNGDQARVLARLAEAVIDIDSDRAERLAFDAEIIAAREAEPGVTDYVLARMAAQLVGIDADLAESLARHLTDPEQRTYAHTHVAIALAAVDPDRAETLTRDIADPVQQNYALVHTAIAAGSVDLDRAEILAHRISDLGEQAYVLSTLAERASTTNSSYAVRLTDKAVAIARDLLEPAQQTHILGVAAKAIAQIDPDRAAGLAADAETTARSITDTAQQANPLAHLARAVATFDLDHAETTARTIVDLVQRVQVLADLADVAADQHPDRAVNLAREVVSLVDDLPEFLHHFSTRADVVKAIARIDPDRAEAIARSISDLGHQSAALTLLVDAWALTAPDRAESIALSIHDPIQQADALTRLAAALAKSNSSRNGIAKHAAVETSSLNRPSATTELTPRQSKRLLAIALSVAPMERALPAFPVVAPTVLHAIAVELMDNQGLPDE
ncbi:hypothetical protein [Nocardia sp. NPDC050710]|uniref:hypothetical protein n=1 Tax=Nocardia sp. NPDC050710 TaxID=3157220 RepID=UPI0034060FAC